MPGICWRKRSEAFLSIMVSSSSAVGNCCTPFSVITIKSLFIEYLQLLKFTKDRKVLLLCGLFAVKTAKNGRSGGTRTRGLQYPKLARYQLRYTSIFCFLNLYWTKLSAYLSARPVGLNAPSHSRRVSLAGSLRRLLALGLSLRKISYQEILLAHYQLRYTSIYCVLMYCIIFYAICQ